MVNHKQLGIASVESIVSVEGLIEDPPDGVDLTSLGPGGEALVSPEECLRHYTKAFEDAGGDEQLACYANMSKTLARQLADEPKPVSQLLAWQSYDLNTLMNKLGEDSPVRQFGIEQIEKLVDKIRTQTGLDMELSMAKPKGWSRASVKTRIKYGQDCSRLVDYNRATIVCDNIKRVYAVVTQMFQEWGPTARRASIRIKEFEDHYQHVMDGGYRHIQLLVFIGASMWEIQVNTKPMVEAKHRSGHKLYKTTRFVKELIMFAALDGSGPGLAKLLSYPGVVEVADPNAVRDKNGLTALHHAAFRGDVHIMQMLWDPSKVQQPADAWATDATIHGGLPLNYAMQMRSWEVVQLLIDKMIETFGDRKLERIHYERLTEACAVAIDSCDEAPGLMEALIKLWVAVGVTSDFGMMNPLDYAFHVKHEGALVVLVNYFDIWQVDQDGCLPVEKAIRLKLQATVELLASKMTGSKPLAMTPEAARSLSRCRNGNVEALTDMILDIDLKLQGRIVSCGQNGDELTLRVHGAQDLELIAESAMDLGKSRISCMVIDDETAYIGASNGHIHMYDLSDMKEVFIFKGHTQYVTDIILGSKRPMPDKTMKVKRLFSASMDNNARVWDLIEKTCVASLKHAADVTTLCRLGSFLYCASKDKIYQWNLNKIGQKAGDLRGHKGHIDTMAVCGGKIYSAGVGGEIHVWDKNALKEGHTADILRGHSTGFRINLLRSGANHSIFSAANPEIIHGGKHISTREWRQQAKDEGPSEVRHWSATGDLFASIMDDQLAFSTRDLALHYGILFIAETTGRVHLWDTKQQEKFADAHLHKSALKTIHVGDVDRDGDESDDSDSATKHHDDRPTASENRIAKLKDQFKQMDPNSDGCLTLEELKRILMAGTCPMQDSLINALFKRMDKNGDGFCVFDEFVDYVFEGGGDADDL